MRNSLNKSPIVRAAALAFGLSIAGATPFAAEAGPLRAGGFHFAHPMSFHHIGGPAMNRFHNRFGFRDNRFFGHRHDGLFLGGGWGWYPGPLGYDTTPAYFNGTVYYADVSGTLKAFAISGAKLGTTPQSQSATQFTYPGTAPSVSANGTANGIVWAHENTATAVLHAYDATNLAHELYNSNQAAANRDQFGTGNKYITPVIADGKVFVGTTNAVAVFGLLK